MKLSPALVALVWFVVVGAGFGIILALNETVRPGALIFVGVCAVGVAAAGYFSRRRELAGLPRGFFPGQSPIVASAIAFLLAGAYAGGFSYFLSEGDTPLVRGALWGALAAWFIYRYRRGVKTSLIQYGAALVAMTLLLVALEIFLKERRSAPSSSIAPS